MWDGALQKNDLERATGGGRREMGDGGAPVKRITSSHRTVACVSSKPAPRDATTAMSAAASDRSSWGRGWRVGVGG